MYVLFVSILQLYIYVVYFIQIIYMHAPSFCKVKKRSSGAVCVVRRWISWILVALKMDCSITYCSSVVVVLFVFQERGL